MYGAEIGEFVCWCSKTLSTGPASGYSSKKKNVCHVAAAWKRSHQWCVSLTPNNTKTIGRMTCHCFLLPIRRDLTSSSLIWATQDSHFMWSSEPHRMAILCDHLSHARKGLATCSTNRVPSFHSYLINTPSIGPSIGIRLGPPTLQSNALLTELILAICILRSFSLRWTCWIGTILQRQSGDQLTENQRKRSRLRTLILLLSKQFS